MPAGAAEVVALAARLGVRIGVAESLTGGLLAAALVDVPGASRAFTGAVVAYDTALKASVLGVDANLLAAVGPVDRDVATQMAAGARRVCATAPEVATEAGGAADIGVATTGVAGPEPDPQTGQPAGTVWLGISSALGERARLLDLAGESRGEVRARTVEAALSLLHEELEAIGSTRER